MQSILLNLGGGGGGIRIDFPREHTGIVRLKQFSWCRADQ